MPASVSFLKWSNCPRTNSTTGSNQSTSALNQTNPCGRLFFSGIETAMTTMNVPAQIHYRELLFFRSCLESSPARVDPRPSLTLGATRLSDRAHSQLHQLKRKLLRVALEQTPETGLFKRLCGAANQAADLAWATAHPLLVFPCLFDDMVKAVRRGFQQEQIRDAQSWFSSLHVDFRFEDNHSVSRGSHPVIQCE